MLVWQLLFLINRVPLRLLEDRDLVVGVQHCLVDRSLVRPRAPVLDKLGSNALQDRDAHLLLEDGCPLGRFAEALGVMPTRWPAAEAMSPEASAVQRVEKLVRIGYEPRGLFERVTIQVLLTQLALVGPDPADPKQLKKGLDTRPSP